MYVVLGVTQWAETWMFVCVCMYVLLCTLWVYVCASQLLAYINPYDTILCHFFLVAVPTLIGNMKIAWHRPDNPWVVFQWSASSQLLDSREDVDVNLVGVDLSWGLGGPESIKWCSHSTWPENKNKQKRKASTQQSSLSSIRGNKQWNMTALSSSLWTSCCTEQTNPFNISSTHL